MKIPDTKLKIQTLGRFRISVDGKIVASDWPHENLKLLFCSLLSPLDLYFNWDRISRSIWGISITPARKRRLDKLYITPLNSFLIKELGFTPLTSEPEGIWINKESVQVDALEFYNAAIDGLKLLSLENQGSAIEKFKEANLLYTGSYLPGMSGNIITNTRNDLESLYRNVVMNSIHPAAANFPRKKRPPPALFQGVW